MYRLDAMFYWLLIILVPGTAADAKPDSSAVVQLVVYLDEQTTVLDHGPLD